MAGIFWDAEKKLFSLVTFKRLKHKLAKKQMFISTAKIFFYQDKAAYDKGPVTMKKLRNLMYKLRKHLVFPPDLVSFDLYLVQSF